ncbi:MAG: hypothetical protein COU35_04045 [Candidatus Magasanikbacteria bacterium CG10_big_fil_rev_8_21_14_0_10_47_10]|uniref:VCBS repeat-containing protein n=1 Tax=Candidatus Magasanikbacteria bacterium CG10_big_fil_rev_8_21_14_0_10_47_10 TaxID=1974652 RepID=A0A2H0TPW6_9BACT|nr:MAG: hypothetical protein COU35_04045 [Candidatus Magasanikbacteria bacterium CG10_big_fil_rev_8_21_14_0_10_47_10]
MYKKITIFLLTWAMVLLPLSSFAASGPAFPRKANTFLQWTMTETEARELAKWDVVILDMEIQERYPEYLRLMRQLNPDIILLAYITSQEVRQDAGSSFSVMRRQLAAGISDTWFLQNTARKRLNRWPGTWLLNVTDRSPAGIGGQQWRDYLISFVVNRILATDLWDGVFYDNAWDNITYFAGSNIDLNLDGRIDYDADQQWREGMEFIYTQTRARAGSHNIIVGNGNTKAYTDLLNGKYIENFIPASWKPALNTYRDNEQTQQSPTVNIINSNTANGVIAQNDYRHFRFGLTSTLLENGYFSFDYGDQDHSQTWWYDEYDVDLGLPTSEAMGVHGEEAYEPSVWRREFGRGLAVVNSTAQEQTIALNGEFEKIRGTQDPLVNDGSIVSEITVGANDGQVLLKTFQSVQNILFTNGSFVRFFRPDGTRVRNGFFSFDEAYQGGVQIAKKNLDETDGQDLLVVTGNRIDAWRSDNGRFLRVYPFTANYKAGLRVAMGDINGDNRSEIIVAPEPGANSPMPVKIYDLSGNQLGDDWYPFGRGYLGGYSVAVAKTKPNEFGKIVIGSGKNKPPEVRIYTESLVLESSWNAYESVFRGGVNVAAGDLDGDGIDEIVTGPGSGGKPWVKVFSSSGIFDPQSNFQAYSTPAFLGIDVRVTDVDFDGKEDIVGMTDGVL